MNVWLQYLPSVVLGGLVLELAGVQSRCLPIDVGGPGLWNQILISRMQDAELCDEKWASEGIRVI